MLRNSTQDNEKLKLAELKSKLNTGKIRIKADKRGISQDNVAPPAMFQAPKMKQKLPQMSLLPISPRLESDSNSFMMATPKQNFKLKPNPLKQMGMQI